MTAGELNTARAEYVARAGLQHALRQHAQQNCGPYSDLTNYSFGNDEYNTKLIHDLGATTSHTISVDQDGWIESGAPASVSATGISLQIRLVGTDVRRAVYRYDLSSLTPKAAILSATARFYADQAHPEGPIEVHALTRDWDETNASWNLLGDAMDTPVLASIPPQPGAGVWVSVDLTSQVQAWVNGADNFGITLNAATEGTQTVYVAREGAQKPYLEVIVGTPPTSPAKLQSSSKIDGGGAAKILREVTLVRQSGFVRLQPDAAEGDDAEIWDQAPNNNYGAEDETWVSSAASDTTRSLLRFNMGAIPAAAKILQASLSLEHESGAGADQPVSAHRIRNAWNEDAVTWNRRDTGINWDSAGGDFDSAAVTTTPVGPANQRYSWNITPLVQGWVDGKYPNYGVVLVAAIAGMPGERFYTSDDADPSRWPSLSVTYACQCGIACLSPGGSSKKIIMIGDWPGPNPDLRDQEKEEIIESWGYEVDHADDDFIWAIDFNNYDAVYVSETASSAAVTGQLNWRSIGIVNEQGNLNDDLGFASAKNTTTGDSLEITDNDHYISAPFALGQLSIYNADMEIIHASGSLATGMQILGEVGSAESLMTLDTGAIGINGPAAGKRVALPLGRDTNSDFNWTYLNNNGRLLVQRSIEWAAGGGKIFKGNLLMVVGNDASLTSQEVAKKQLFETWGYSVNVIDEDDSQTDFNTALAANDVVFIGEDVVANDVNTKLTDATIGVVTEEDNLSDEFGFSASIHWDSGTSLSIDNSHYITTPLPAGDVTILTTSESLADLTGTLAPGIDILGDNDAGPALATLEIGASVFGGGTATGRRVILPWGGNDMDINHLNNDGLTILERSLEWASSKPDLSPFAHWKLDETSGFNAVDSEGGNDGTLTSGPVWTPGLFEGGLDFDGSNDYVDAGTFDVSGSGITMMGWFNAEAIAGDDPRIVSKASGTNEADAWWQLSTTDSGADRYLRMRIKAGGTTTTLADSSTNLVTDRWYFAVGTYDSASGDMRLYLDGVEIASGSHAFGGAIDTDPSVPVAIGANGTADRFFNGILDDVRVYDRALSSGEIAELALLPGPIAHWKLDDASGSTAIDSVGGNDATLNGNPAWTTGVADGALEFDGSGDYATTDSNFTPPPVGTVSFWMKVPGSPASHGRILGLHDTWEVRHVTSGTPDGIPYGLVFDLGVSGVNTEFITTVTVDSPGQWYFVAATYDTNNDAYQVYLDGSLHKSGTYPSSLSVPAANPLSLGTRTGSSNYFDGILDDVRVYDRVLSASEINDLYAASAPPAPSYNETYEPWTASSADTWETVSLATFGVPSDAVVEVAIINDKGDRERFGGVRAVGSSLDRYLRLQEAESGGTDVVTMHVQTDSSSQIQHYSDNTGDVSFILLGYWTGASYVELFEPFTADSSNTWVEEDVGNDGLGPNQIAEIVMLNSNQSNERLAGVRASGSSYQRRFNLHEAEDGGIDAYSMMVNTDASSIIEVFAQSSTDVEFVVLGYWDTPPGTYVENGVGPWTASTTSWETIGLGGIGVPADAVVQVTIGNLNQSNERLMGVREVGSGLDRRLDLHKAEAGGSERATWHVNADAGSNIQSYAEASGAASRFAPVGWWVLAP